MKFSTYNHLFKSKRHNVYLLYNSLTNSLIKIDNAEILTAINNLKFNINNIDFSNNQEFYKKLIESKIIIESDEIEVLKIKNKILNNRYSTSTLVITLLPTLSCNFKCPYCFVKNSSDFSLNDDIENRILQFIQKKIDIQKTSYLNLSWMGGEPLLNYKRIKSFTKKIDKLNIKYIANLVTNGYLLTKEKIKELENLHIELVQVTLDGLSEYHNLTRIHKDKSETFNKIINNIENFCNLYGEKETIGLNIRINLNKNEDYEKKFIEAYNYLKEKFPFKNIYISPGFIEDISNNGMNNCSTFNNKLIKEFYIELNRKYSIKEYSLYPRNTITECAARSGNTYIIGPKAELYTCWDNIGKEAKIIGRIEEKGILNITDESTYIKYLAGADYLDEPECLKCFCFPICNGGCPEKRIRKLYENASFDCCIIHKYFLEEILENYYETKIVNHVNL